MIKLLISFRLSTHVYEQNIEGEDEKESGDSTVKTLSFSKDFLKDRLIHQVVGWLNQKFLDAKVSIFVFI